MLSKGNVIRGVLLAAGQATRLRPLTDNCPKCLLAIGNETILGRSIRLLSAAGITSFTIVDGFCGDLIRTALSRDFPHLDFTFIRNEDYASTNNAWSLMLADCRGDEPVFLLDSDIIFEPAVLTVLMANGAPNCLGLRTSGDIAEEEMKVSLDAAGRVATLSKALAITEAAGESVGLEMFSAEFMAALHEVLQRRMHVDGHVDEYYEEAFTELAGAGQVIMPVDLGDLRCMEIDTPEDLAEARKIFAAAERGESC